MRGRISRMLVALLLAGDPACGSPVGPCPPGTIDDDERARALLAASRGTDAGRGRVGEAVKICFGGTGRGSLRHDGVVVLADSLDREAGAARLTHMAMHVADGLHRFPAADVPCERQMEAALTAEARAIVAEIEACEQLGCDAPPYTFATSVLASAPAGRATDVLARLRAEPAADGLDALVHGYRRRCQAAR